MSQTSTSVRLQPEDSFKLEVFDKHRRICTLYIHANSLGWANVDIQVESNQQITPIGFKDGCRQPFDALPPGMTLAANIDDAVCDEKE